MFRQDEKRAFRGDAKNRHAGEVIGMAILIVCGFYDPR
jgi:hypothetical protein